LAPGVFFCEIGFIVAVGGYNNFGWFGLAAVFLASVATVDTGIVRVEDGIIATVYDAIGRIESI
jgi:hypothetical protein